MSTVETPASKNSFSSHILLGVRFDIVTKDRAKQWVEKCLQNAGQKTIFTPNPEMLVKARNDSGFKEILNTGDLNLCDGTGTNLALSLAGVKTERIAGSDFVSDICKIAEQLKKSIYILGIGHDEILKKAATALQQRFPLLVIAGSNKGLELEEGFDGSSSLRFELSVHETILLDIKRSAPDILFVAFGMGKQEKWIHQFLPELGSVKLAMGVGGSFEFIADAIPRAPRWMRRCGLEWLFRWCQEPKRAKRMWNAVVKFSALAVIDWFKKHDQRLR